MKSGDVQIEQEKPMFSYFMKLVSLFEIWQKRLF